MPKDVTVTFKDGTTHVYQGAPDGITPDEVEERALKEFGKPVASLSRGAAPKGGKLERTFGGDMKKALLKTARDFGGSIPFIDKPGQYQSDPLALPGDIGAIVTAAARPVVKPVSDAMYDAGIRPSAGEGVGTAFRYRQMGRDEAADELTDTALTAIGMVAPAKPGPPVRGAPARAPKAPNLRAQKVRALQDMGVDLTPGQMAGGIVQNLEDSVMTTAPAVRNAKTRANVALNEGVMNDALAPIKGSVKGAGREAVESMHTQVGDALDKAFGNAKFAKDAQLHRETMRSWGDVIPYSQKDAVKIYDQFIKDASHPGGLSEAFARLNKFKMQAARDGKGDLADFIQTLQGNVLDNIARNGSAADALAVREARDAFRRSIVPETAAAKVGAEGGVPTPEQLFNAVRVADRTARKNAFAQGKAQYQGVAEAAKEVMGRTVGSSGTAERLTLSDPIRFVMVGARNVALSGLYNKKVVSLLNNISRAQTPRAVRVSLEALKRLAATDKDAARALTSLSSGTSAGPSIASQPYQLPSAAEEQDRQPRRKTPD